jgi:hypothetical protein
MGECNSAYGRAIIQRRRARRVGSLQTVIREPQYLGTVGGAAAEFQADPLTR